jgi:hypothetical protein
LTHIKKTPNASRIFAPLAALLTPVQEALGLPKRVVMQRLMCDFALSMTAGVPRGGPGADRWKVIADDAEG